jgi:hypothetical protein
VRSRPIRSSFACTAALPSAVATGSEVQQLLAAGHKCKCPPLLCLLHAGQLLLCKPRVVPCCPLQMLMFAARRNSVRGGFLAVSTSPWAPSCPRCSGRNSPRVMRSSLWYVQHRLGCLPLGLRSWPMLTVLHILSLLSCFKRCRPIAFCCRHARLAGAQPQHWKR